MRKIEKYYENTADANPNYIVKKFIELKIGPGNGLNLDVEQEGIQYI